MHMLDKEAALDALAALHGELLLIDVAVRDGDDWRNVARIHGTFVDWSTDEVATDDEFDLIIDDAHWLHFRWPELRAWSWSPSDKEDLDYTLEVVFPTWRARLTPM